MDGMSVTATDQTNTPSTAGWSIGDKSHYHSGGTWQIDHSDAGMFRVSAMPIPHLGASNVAATGATLTLSDYEGAWRYKYTSPAAPAGQCSSEIGAGTSTATLSNLTPGETYTFKAYSDSSCSSSNEIATAAAFTTIKLSASNVTGTGATLTLVGHSAAWRYKYTAPATPAGQCSAEISAGTSTAALTGLAPGVSYTFKAYSDSTCTSANEITDSRIGRGVRHAQAHRVQSRRHRRDADA